MKSNGWRRTLAQTLADEARLSEQSRMRATNLNSRGTNLELVGEDVPNHSLLEVSWCIVAMGTNAPLAWFGLMCTAWENTIIKCGSPSSQVMMSYGRGERNEYGHLQGITRIMTHVSLKDRIRKWMRAELLLGTSQYRAKVGFAFFTGRANLTKKPESADRSRRKPSGSRLEWKERNNKQKEKRSKPAVVRSRNPLFFYWAPHDSRQARGANTEVEPQRPEAGSTTDPIAPTVPAVGMRAGR